MKKQIAHELVSIAKRLLDLAATLERTKEPEPPAKPPASRVCTKCGLPIVGGMRPVRGAHYHCYRQLIRLIKDGLITEEDRGLVECVFRRVFKWFSKTDAFSDAYLFECKDLVPIFDTVYYIW